MLARSSCAPLASTASMGTTLLAALTAALAWIEPLPAAAASAAADAAAAAGPMPPDRPQYICVNNNQQWHPNDPSSFTQATVDAVLAAVNGSKGSADGRVRLCLSFDFWVLYAGFKDENKKLPQAPDVATMVRSAETLAALAEANDLPLSVSIDATQYWNTRPDLWQWWDPAAEGFNPANRMNVEWTGWNATADATSVSWRNWGSQFRMPTPPPNFASPAFRAAAAEVMTPVAQVFSRWYTGLPREKKYLLAYVRCTQELWEGTNYYVYPNSTLPGGGYAWPKALDPTTGPKGTLQLGYAALCTAGKQCEGNITDAALDGVVSDFIRFAAGVLAGAGVPRSRLMSHTGAAWGGHGPDPALAWNTAAAAVTSAAAPGWSLYAGSTNASSNTGLGAALDALDGTPWGAPEWLRTFDNSGSAKLWTDAFLSTMRFKNNRLIVVQNFGSIQRNPGALEALVGVLGAAPFATCFVDAAVELTAVALNITTWRLSWAAAGSNVDTARVDVAMDAQPLLPSGRLAAPIFTLSLTTGESEVFFRVPTGGSPPFYFTISNTGCDAGQTVVSDVYGFGDA
jgi:hypothetical protein